SLQSVSCLVQITDNRIKFEYSRSSMSSLSSLSSSHLSADSSSSLRSTTEREFVVRIRVDNRKKRNRDIVFVHKAKLVGSAAAISNNFAKTFHTKHMATPYLKGRREIHK
ncbi:hypothetical protein ACROYT_G007492, partial [Oculina patagonica]